MPVGASLLLLGVVWLAAGCGCSETGLEGRADGGSDAASDADASLDPVVDAYVDADPDVPGVVLEGAPVLLGDGNRRPSVVWNAEGWTVLFQVLDSAGERLELLFVDETVTMSRSVAMPPAMTGPHSAITGPHHSPRWSGGVYGVAGDSYMGRESVQVLFCLVDESGVVVAGPVTVAESSSQTDPDVGWLDAIPGWVVGYLASGVAPGPVADRAASYVLLDPDGTIASGPGRVGPGSISGPRLSVLDGEIVSMVWMGLEGLWFRSFPGDDLESSPEAERVYDSSLFSEAFIGADTYDGNTYVLGITRSEVGVVVVDSASGEPVSGLNVIGGSENGNKWTGIAGAPGRGYLGACYPIRYRWVDEEQMAFHLVSEDGAPLDEEITIDSGTRHFGDCAVGWSGSEFLVVYVAEFQVFAQRLRPVI